MNIYKIAKSVFIFGLLFINVTGYAQRSNIKYIDKLIKDNSKRKVYYLHQLDSLESPFKKKVIRKYVNNIESNMSLIAAVQYESQTIFILTHKTSIKHQHLLMFKNLFFIKIRIRDYMILYGTEELLGDYEWDDEEINLKRKINCRLGSRY